MKLDCMLTDVPLGHIPERTRLLEGLGYAGLFTDENRHDPFLPLALAAEHTTRVELGTSIAVALSRSPMQVANVGHDLQGFSGGRVIIGLGPQVRPHIEKRFSATWSHPAARMREFVLALRAIWRCWETGERLEFVGEFYRHTLMTPNFTPEPNGFGAPRVWLAAVGPRMTEAAGEVADGVLLHPFSTAHYVRDHTLPALRRGQAAGARDATTIAGRTFVITDDASADWVRRRIAFYGSTPGYRPVLDAHGWGAAQDELNALSRQGRWDEMAGLITDEMLETFAVTGTLEEVPHLVRQRFGGLYDRVGLAPAPEDPTAWREIVAAFA